MTTPAHLDRATCRHLMAWCERQFTQPQEAAEALEAFVNSMTPEDREHALECGWRFVADLYARANPGHWEVFNS